MKFKIGQRIKVRQKVNKDNGNNNYEPNIGDRGRIINVKKDQIYVKFDAGSKVSHWFFYDCSG